MCTHTPRWHSLLGEGARSKKSIFLPQWQTNFFPSTNHHRRTKYKREHWKLIRSEPFYTTCDAAILCCWVWVEVMLLLLLWCYCSFLFVTGCWIFKCWCLFLRRWRSKTRRCPMSLGPSVLSYYIDPQPCLLLFVTVCYCLLMFVTGYLA